MMILRKGKEMSNLVRVGVKGGGESGSKFTGDGC